MELEERTVRSVMHDLLETFGQRLSMIADTLDGQVSLNMLRVRGEVALALLAGEEVTAADIARRTGLNPTTVHRIVSRLLEEGAVRELPHPEDGRKRVLSYTNRQWQHMAALADDWIALSLESLKRDLGVLRRHGLIQESAEAAIAEFVIQVRSDGTLRLSGADIGDRFLPEPD